MGVSRAFGCFKDPEAQALKKQKKAGKRIHSEKAQPNRVITAAGSGDQAGIGSQARIEMRNPPEESPLTATMTMQNYEPSSPELGDDKALGDDKELGVDKELRGEKAPGDDKEIGDDEPEPWTVGAVIRHTMLLQARLAEAANERKQTKEEVDVPNSRARRQATVEEDVEIPTGATKPEAVAEQKEHNKTSTGETTSTINLTTIENRDGGEGSVHATMMFGLPTTRKGPEVDLEAIAAEAENKTRKEENARAAKGPHNGKHGGAVNWDQAYSQRAPPIYSNDRDTRKSGWGFADLSGSFGSAMDEPYYDYEIGMSSGSASNSYSLPNGYGQKRKSHYAYVSGPAN